MKRPQSVPRFFLFVVPFFIAACSEPEVVDRRAGPAPRT